MSVIHFIKSHVIKGFGRGSRELGCPTANVADIDHLNMSTGIYCGLAQITISSQDQVQKESTDDSESYNKVLQKLPMTSRVIGWVGSFGFNPTYGNKEKSLEVHLFHEFGYNFYGAQISVLICKRLRDEAKYNSLDELKDAIANDIKSAEQEIKQFGELIDDTRYFIKSS